MTTGIVLGGVLFVLVVVLFGMLLTGRHPSRRTATGSDGSVAMFGDGGSGGDSGCDAGSGGDCGGGGDGGGGGGGD
jgi:hypothetical protein